MSTSTPAPHALSNTRVFYVYRDGTNCKQSHQVVLAGAITFSDVERFLDQGEWFIPHDVGLEELQSRMRGFPNLDHDHPWHELHDDNFAPTADPPTIALTAAELRQRFQQVNGQWQEKAAMARLGLQQCG